MILEYFLLGAFIFIIFSLIFWNIDSRYYFGGPEVEFKEDENIAIGLYPKDLKTVFLFSCDDISSKTKVDDLLMILRTLEKYDVKGTFFTIPLLEGKYSVSNDIIKMVLKGKHEIAQHGLTHQWRRTSRIPILNTLEFRGLNHEEQEKRISEGKTILNSVHVNPEGFRTAHFSSNEGTLELLTKDDFLYNSDVRIRPEGRITNKRFLGIVYGSIYFPYFWKTQFGKILIIPANGDYIWGLKTGFMEQSALRAAKNRYNKFHKKGGVFCLLTHLHTQALPGNRAMSFLDSFLKHAKEKDAWSPTMLDFAKWWNARHSLKVLSYNRRGKLVIKLEKPSKYSLNNLTVNIKLNKEYIISYGGKTKSGEGPEKVSIDF